MGELECGRKEIVKKFGLILGALFVSGCAATHKPIQGPDGTEHQLITCGPVEACYKAARTACNGNYKIINTSTETTGLADSGTSSLTKLLVKCK